MARKLQWYLTTYARLSNGEFELITYTPMPSLEVAQHRSKVTLPNNEFYEVECRVGSLLPKTPKPCWVARDRYSHKSHVAQLQCEAEVKAQQLLDILDSNIFDVKSLLKEMQLLKPILTKPQYNILLNALMSKPCVIKILNERGAM